MKKLIPLVLVILVVGVLYYINMDKVRWTQVTSSVLGVSFQFPAHTANGDDPLKGTESFVIPYDHIPTGPRDWTISTAVKRAVVSTMRCDPLLGTGTFLPVDFTGPMQCGVVKSPSQVVSVYVIGFGRPDGGTAYPESMVLSLRDKQADALTNILKFPQTESEANAKVDLFTKAHPQAVIWPPDANAQQLYKDVEAVVTKALSTPYQEVTDGLVTLKGIAETMKPL